MHAGYFAAWLGLTCAASLAAADDGALRILCCVPCCGRRGLDAAAAAAQHHERQSLTMAAALETPDSMSVDAEPRSFSSQPDAAAPALAAVATVAAMEAVEAMVEVRIEEPSMPPHPPLESPSKPLDFAAPPTMPSTVPTAAPAPEGLAALGANEEDDDLAALGF